MDYTAFGEEIAANVGMRTTVQGFNAPNKLDEKYAKTERDKATGLDHTWFRKLENQGGRWTSPDPYNGSMSLGNPQSFNRYSYVENQPTNFIDPSGLQLRYFDVRQGLGCVFDERDGKYHCTEYINRYWYDDGIGNGGESGGDEFFGRGSGGGQSSNLPEDKTDCEIFVNLLVSAVEYRRNLVAARVRIGTYFTVETTRYFQLDKEKVGKVTGFINYLVASGQDSDVYRHITGGAASVLLDGIGIVSGVDDYRQIYQENNADTPERRKEARASRAGNQAGRSVGNAIADRIRGSITAEKLKSRISNSLCEN